MWEVKRVLGWSASSVSLNSRVSTWPGRAVILIEPNVAVKVTALAVAWTMRARAVARRTVCSLRISLARTFPREGGTRASVPAGSMNYAPMLANFQVMVSVWLPA
jgi:hypothetical protein